MNIKQLDKNITQKSSNINKIIRSVSKIIYICIKRLYKDQLTFKIEEEDNELIVEEKLLNQSSILTKVNHTWILSM